MSASSRRPPRHPHAYSPSTTQLIMLQRGRSRNISAVALARQASEERERTRVAIASMDRYPLPCDPEKFPPPRFLRPTLPSPSTSPSPASTPLALTPPDPVPLHTHRRTRTLRVDDLHAPLDPRMPATAAHIASTSASYPTPIAKPRPKALPPPPSQPPTASTSTPTADARARRARQRATNLARAESVFVAVLARTRHERIATLMARARAEEERKERARMARQAEALERRGHPLYVARGAPVYRVLGSRPPPAEAERFTYAAFPMPASASRPNVGAPKTRVALVALADPNAVNARSVPFKDVRASMRGALFPGDEVRDGRESSMSGSSSVTVRGREKERELLGVLLEAVKSEAEERWQAKGKAREVRVRVREDVAQRECEACVVAFAASFQSYASSLSTSASAPTSTSASTSFISRPSSWLSFGSRKSVSSVTTAGTTPASSVFKSHRHSPSPPVAPSTLPTPDQKHSCGREHAQCFISVTVEESPLGDGPTSSSPTPKPSIFPAPPSPDPDATQHPANPSPHANGAWRAVRQLVAAAARMQQAYVAATVATLASADYADAASRSRSPSVSPARPVRPQGTRVAKADVTRFLVRRGDARAVPYALLPLRDISPASPVHPHTPACATFPFISSPNQDAANGHPRARPVANPRHMLSRALANARRVRTPSAHTIPQPERVVGIAWDVHQHPTNGGSALRSGWRVVWDETEHLFT